MLSFQDFVKNKFINESVNVDSFLSSPVYYGNINEGGAAGHMYHPFEDWNLTFANIKDLINKGLSGELNIEEDVVEKTDGQNIFATIINDEVYFARNKGDMKNPVSLRDFIDRWANHDSKMVRKAYTIAAQELSDKLGKLPENIKKDFENGLNFLNIEIIFSKNPNVIYYDKDVIQFHNIKKTDGEGNVISVERSKATEIAKILKDLNQDMGELFSIIPPQKILLAKDTNFDENRKKFLSRLEKLKSEFNLQDSDKVSLYHEMKWRSIIEREFSNVSQDIKEGLLQRWAFENKKALDWRSLKKVVDESQERKIKEFDKKDAKKVFKENIRPFEDIILELGSVVLKNASNFLVLSPDKEKQRLQAEIRKAADKIKSTGDENAIKKLEFELERLSRIGGIESIIPTEGLVFTYQGKEYKLTGTYAAANQLLGVLRYPGR